MRRGNGRVVLNTLIFNIIAMIQFVLSAIGAVLYLTYISPPYWDCLLGNTLTGTELLICEEQQWVRHSVYWSVIAVVPISVVAFAATAYDAVSIWSQRYKKITEPTNATVV